jgi:hypothetical protein
MRMMLRTHIDATHGSDALKSEPYKRRSRPSSRSSSRKPHISGSKAASEPPFSSSIWKTLTSAPRSPRRFSIPAAIFIYRRA